MDSAGSNGPGAAAPRSGERGGEDRVRVRVPAKVNLALRVGELGDDGYHPLGTVFQALSLFDEIEASRRDEGIHLEMKGEGSEELPVDDSNLAVRAANLLRERYDITEGVDLRIRKHIPIAGGMAGGSANAAGVLTACSMLWDLDTQPEDLHDFAAELGSDVPFALVGGTARGTGRGTELVPMITRGTYHWVLAFAHDGLSTPAVFRRFDEMLAAGEVTPGTEVPRELMDALAKGDVRGVGAALCNDLEAPALSLRPELGEVLEMGRALGVAGAVLSGSGPTCAFLAEGETAAMDLATQLSKNPRVRTVRRATAPVHGSRPLV